MNIRFSRLLKLAGKQLRFSEGACDSRAHSHTVEEVAMIKAIQDVQAARKIDQVNHQSPNKHEEASKTITGMDLEASCFNQ